MTSVRCSARSKTRKTQCKRDAIPGGTIAGDLVIVADDKEELPRFSTWDAFHAEIERLTGSRFDTR